MTFRSLKYIIPSLLVPAAVFFGCSGGPAGEQHGPAAGDAAIGFSASTETVTPLSRAVADFPNTSIGVSATYSTTPGDWRSYGDIDNQRATVTGESGGVFEFTWDTKKYWPFDGTGLIFAAYSPHDSDASSISLNGDLVHLDITLANDLPDVLYASDNGAVVFSKTDGIAELGEFRHAMSKLTVVVTADPQSFNTDVKLTGLTVSTPKGRAVLDLLTDGSLQYFYGYPFSYDLVSAETAFNSTSPFTRSVYLFPGTEDDTTVKLTLKDSSYEFDASYILSQVMTDADPAVPLSLVRGKNTTLTITVVGTSVQNPDENIKLQGLLTDWYDNGELIVTIN